MNEADVAVWVDGGWGVDALVGRETRLHKDLDLLVAATDVQRAAAVLAGHGFRHRAGTSPAGLYCDDAGRCVDLSVVTPDDGGGYFQETSRGTTRLAVEDLSGRGTIGGLGSLPHRLGAASRARRIRDDREGRARPAAASRRRVRPRVRAHIADAMKERGLAQRRREPNRPGGGSVAASRRCGHLDLQSALSFSDCPSGCVGLRRVEAEATLIRVDTLDIQSVLAVVEAERERTARQIAALEAIVAAIVEGSELISTDDEHDPEGATIAYERAQASALLRQARADCNALLITRQQLQEGRQVICSVCGREIDLERVAGTSDHDACVDCAALPAIDDAAARHYPRHSRTPRPERSVPSPSWARATARLLIYRSPAGKTSAEASGWRGLWTPL